jgi:hypothetical protein
MNPMIASILGFAPQPNNPPMDYGGGQAVPCAPQASYQQQPQQQPAWYPASHNVIPKRPIAAAVIAIIGVVMLCISLATPWYGIKMDMSLNSGFGMSASMSVDSKYDFEGADADVGMEYMGMKMSVTCSTSWDSDIAKNSTATKEVFKTTQVLDILAVIMTVMLIVGAILMIFRPGRKPFAVVFGLLAIFLCLMGPLYFMTQLPVAQKSDQAKSLSITNILPEVDNLTQGDGPWKSFCGSNSQTINSGASSIPLKMSWGPDSGWYLGWTGFAFSVIGFILVLTTKRPTGQPAYGGQPRPQFYEPPGQQYSPQPQTQYYEPPGQQYNPQPQTQYYETPGQQYSPQPQAQYYETPVQQYSPQPQTQYYETPGQQYGAPPPAAPASYSPGPPAPPAAYYPAQQDSYAAYPPAQPAPPGAYSPPPQYPPAAYPPAQPQYRPPEQK